MSKQSTIVLYKTEISEIKAKMQKTQARFNPEDYKSCNKYPSSMHEELYEKYMKSYENEVKQLAELISELI